VARIFALVSLIHSAHPGVIAFQAAASGIPTVTNVFGRRDAALLRRISDNIVPYDPVHDSLLDCIERTLTMDKGRPSFDASLYASAASRDLPGFIDGILRAAAPRPLSLAAAMSA
jgi:hypothetical protein